MAALGPEPGRADRQALPEFAASYQAIARRRGKKIATTAIARKLLTRAYHLLAAQAAATPGTAKSHTPVRQPDHQDAHTDQERVTKPGHARPCGMSRPPGRARSFD